jgi:hypothetical protein
MNDKHMVIGLVLVTAAVATLALQYARARKSGRFPFWGWLGFAIIGLAELLLYERVPFVATFFTPIVWTGYLLAADGLVRHVQGKSRLSSEPRAFLTLAFWSVPLWLIFEAYNVRLQNWTYLGTPLSPIVAEVGYAWAFATIWPAIFETADLIRALRFFPEESRFRLSWGAATIRWLVIAGALFVAIPVMLPVRLGAYLFGFVWLGFILLLDPLNARLGGASFLRELEQGRPGRFWSFLASGVVCGFLWEFWNLWAAGRWVYIFPMFQHWKIFEMPLPGFLGFPPFALECFVMYEFLLTVRRQWQSATTGRRLASRVSAEGR